MDMYVDIWSSKALYHCDTQVKAIPMDMLVPWHMMIYLKVKLAMIDLFVWEEILA